MNLRWSCHEPAAENHPSPRDNAVVYTVLDYRRQCATTTINSEGERLSRLRSLRPQLVHHRPTPQVALEAIRVRARRPAYSRLEYGVRVCRAPSRRVRRGIEPHARGTVVDCL